MPGASADLATQLGIVAGAAAAAGAAAWIARRLPRGGGPDRSRARAALLLAAGTAAFAAPLSYLALKKFSSFLSPAVDLGVQHHLFWAGGRGGFLYQTVLFATSHLNHVTLFTQLISPLSLIFPSARTLPVLQIFALASAAIPAYLLARRYTSSRYLALAFAFSPLLFAPVQWAALYDFHPRTFAPALIWWGLWGIETGRGRLGLLSFFFTALLLEELALYTGAAGLFIAFGLKKRRPGLLLAGFSAVHFIIATYVVYPQLMDVSDPGSNPILNTFGVATSPAELLRYAGTHPLEFLRRAADPARANYLLHMVTPWAFLPLAAGWVAPAYATPVIYALFSIVPSHYALPYHYAMPLVPFLVYAAVRAWGRLEKAAARRTRFAPDVRRAGTAFFLVAGVASSVAFGPLGFRHHPTWYAPRPSARGFADVARFVSPERSLAASMFLLPHFSERWRIYLHPHKQSYLKRLRPYEVLVRCAGVDEPWTVPPREAEAQSRLTLLRYLRDRRYGCVYADGAYVLLRRGATPLIPSEEVFARTFQMIEGRGLDANVGVSVFDPAARDYRAVYCNARQGVLGTLARAGPRYWPPGLVKVNYRLAARRLTRPFAPVADLVVIERPEAGPPAVIGRHQVLPTDLPSNGTYGWAAVAFACDGARRYEFQLYPRGNGDLYLDYILVEAPGLSLAGAYREAETPSEKAARAAKEEAFKRFVEPAPPGFALR